MRGVKMAEVVQTAGQFIIDRPRSSASAALRPNYCVWRARFTKLLLVCVWGLIFMGALVTSHDAGLAVPDWPTTYGHNMFLYPPSLWIDGIFYEHVHRLIASFVGFLTLIAAVWFAFKEPRVWVRRLAWVALAVVLVQGILGGLTVLYQLPDAISVSHALLAQTFMLIVLALAYSQSKELCEHRSQQRSPGGAISHKEMRAGFLLGLAVLAVLYIQLLTGAMMRHSASGLAVPDFPTMAGSWWPSLSAETLAKLDLMRAQLAPSWYIDRSPLSVYRLATHLAHRFWSLVTVLSLLFFILRCRSFRRHASNKGLSEASGILHKIALGAKLLSLLLLVQFSLGILTVLSVRHPYGTSMHVVCGALLLAAAGLQTLRFFVLSTTADSRALESAD
jgi:cytochrome c oxidase assembly protein subunit 15